MTEREIDDALGALRATLQVEPSPAFAAGVRARIDRQRRTGWATWLVLSAAAAGVVLGIVLLSRSTASRAGVAELARVRPPGASVAATPIVAPVQTAVPPIAAAAAIAATAARAAEPTPGRVKPAEPGRVFEVLVPADQRLALTKLLADLDAGRVEGAALVAKPVEPAPPIPPPTELVIAPIEIPAIGGGAGGNQIIR